MLPHGLRSHVLWHVPTGPFTPSAAWALLCRVSSIVVESVSGPTAIALSSKAFLFYFLPVLFTLHCFHHVPRLPFCASEPSTFTPGRAPPLGRHCAVSDGPVFGGSLQEKVACVQAVMTRRRATCERGAAPRRVAHDPSIRSPSIPPAHRALPLRHLHTAFLTHSALPVGSHPASTVCLGALLCAASPEQNPQSRDRAAGASSRTLMGEQ
jgi:hypothetical protein